MVAVAFDETGATRILIRATDGIGKSAFHTSHQALPFPAGTGRHTPPVNPSSTKIEETR
jgi:hypothetical protein